MRFRARPASARPLPTRRASSATQRRLLARRLLLEGLEDRRLMAFNLLAEYATGPTPTDLALAHLDGGGQLDLLVASTAEGNGSVRLGRADGTFGDSLSTGASASSLATGDLDGDGITDLVAVNDNVIVQKGNGDGTFQPPQSIALPPLVAPGNPDPTPLPQSLRSIATGDLNADGKLDLVVAGQTTFSLYYRQYVCGYYSCYYTGYWRSFTDGYVNVLLGDGSGGFSDPQVQALGRNHTPAAIAIGDVNGDGHADVVSANGGDNCTLLGDGTGALAAPLHSARATALRSAPLADFDGDGDLDLVTASGETLVISKGLGDGQFGPGSSHDLRQSVDSVVAGDVNADGKLDLVVAGTKSTCTNSGYYGCYASEHVGQTSVLLGDGLGGFSLPIASPLLPDFFARFVDVALADLTGDGLPEVVTIESNRGVAMVAENDGDWVAPVELSISDFTVVEGNDGVVNAVFAITLSGPSTRVVTVDYATADLTPDEQYWYGAQSASADADYEITTGTLAIPVGETTASITVPILGDRVGEPTELFFLDLTSPAYANLARSRAIGTIQDDEPFVSLDNSMAASVVEGNAGTKEFTFRVVLSAASDAPVTVNFTTTDGSAVAGSDYQGATGTVTIPAGETAQTFTVLVNGDTQAEPDEYFTVSLSGATNASIGNALFHATIRDDDSVPEISISDASIVEGHRGTRTMTFTVTLSQPSNQRVTVTYKTANGTAKTSDRDYVARSGTITFLPGQTTRTITVKINGDRKREDDERFYVNLSRPRGAPIADAQGEGTIFNDDNGSVRRSSRSRAAAARAAIDHFLSGRSLKRRG